MSEVTRRRSTGIAGIVASLFILVQVPLYFIYSAAPPDWNILTRSLIGIIGCMFYLVFFVGLRQVIDRVDPTEGWLANLLQVSGLVWVVMVLVPQSLEAGAAISTDQDIDTTTEGPFAAAQYLMQGGISRLLMALFLIVLGIAVTRTAVLPRWVGVSAFILAAINLAFVPALYFGDNAADFYSVQGWGTTATTGALWSLWTLALSISILRHASLTGPSNRNLGFQPDATVPPNY